MKRNKSLWTKGLLALGTWASIFGVASPALAWWETGHMLTAQIGYDNLKPEVRAKADKLVAWLNNTEPDASRHAFVPVAVWMDDTKARGLNAFNEWHYINIPYNSGGLPMATDAKEVNIVERMITMEQTLRSPKTSEFEKAFALRILLHLFGDIHQPYHAVGKLSHETPNGDLGGNLTKINHGDIHNIHAFWDSTAGLFPQITPPNWKGSIPNMAKDLQGKQPRSQYASRLAFNPMAWAQESYALAVKYGYEPLPADGKLTPAYISQAQKICAERLALGGYRLAELLNSAL